MLLIQKTTVFERVTESCLCFSYSERSRCASLRVARRRLAIADFSQGPWVRFGLKTVIEGVRATHAIAETSRPAAPPGSACLPVSPQANLWCDGRRFRRCNRLGRGTIA